MEGYGPTLYTGTWNGSSYTFIAGRRNFVPKVNLTGRLLGIWTPQCTHHHLSMEWEFKFIYVHSWQTKLHSESWQLDREITRHLNMLIIFWTTWRRLYNTWKRALQWFIKFRRILALFDIILFTFYSKESLHVLFCTSAYGSTLLNLVFVTTSND